MKSNYKALEYVKNNPLEMGDLGFKNLAMSRCLRDEKERADARASKRPMPDSYMKLPPQQQRRSMFFMKQFDKGNKTRVVNQSMVHKTKENRFYQQLENQIEQMAKKDKKLVRQPSSEEIIKYIDVDTDLYRAYEGHSQLSTLHDSPRKLIADSSA